MVATGYQVERAVLLTLSSILIILACFVTYTIYMRVKGSKSYLKLPMSCSGILTALFVLIESVDYEAVFGIYNPYLVAAFNHSACSTAIWSGALLIILHLELVYKFMRISPPQAIRRIGFACGAGHWVLGNVCILLMVTVNNEIFIGLFFMVYVVTIATLLLFVNISVCRVINSVKNHLRESQMKSAPELERVMRQSRSFQIGESIVLTVGVLVLAMRAASSFHSQPLVYGPSNPLWMDPNNYSWGATLVSAMLLADYFFNIWMYVGERQAAKNKSTAGSKSHDSQLSTGKSFKGTSITRGKSSKHMLNTQNQKGNETSAHTLNLSVGSGNGSGLDKPVSLPLDLSVNDQWVGVSKTTTDNTNEKKGRGEVMMADISHTHHHNENRSNTQTQNHTNVIPNSQPNDALAVVVADLV